MICSNMSGKETVFQVLVEFLFFFISGTIDDVGTEKERESNKDNER